MLDQALSLCGALMVLGAFVGNLLHRLDRDSALYAALNCVGSGILTYIAVKSGSMGLILIEGSWSFISFIALLRTFRAGPTKANTPAGH